jgi:hypothetical protein
MVGFNANYLNNISMQRPHVVILGAGASRAACRNGDRNGRMLPVMKDLVEVCGLGSLLVSSGVDFDHNDFELLYSKLAADPLRKQLVDQLEKKVCSYFSVLQLPDEPTIYDYIVLSLREKDVVVTFNWDPFLIQAIRRNQHVGKMPRTAFLHGNVAIRYCVKHEPILQTDCSDNCPKCHSQLRQAALLYPVTKKNYHKDSLIEKSWEFTQHALKNAYLLTIFGYGAPQADFEAVELLKSAWDPQVSEQFKTMEVIDIRQQQELSTIWRGSVRQDAHICFGLACLVGPPLTL